MPEHPKGFAVHQGHGRGDDHIPNYIPWSEAEKFRDQAYSNHGQTLERLHERGGLSVMEIHWARKGTRWKSGVTFEEIREAYTWVWANAIS
jgi:hypothetical protein